jgi:hypothetical protein
MCAGFDYGVNNPELKHIHDNGEYSHSTERRQQAAEY